VNGLGNQHHTSPTLCIWLQLITGPILSGQLLMIYLAVLLGIGLSESRTGDPRQIATGDQQQITTTKFHIWGHTPELPEPHQYTVRNRSLAQNDALSLCDIQK
jgi:hypothetical protein